LRFRHEQTILSKAGDAHPMGKTFLSCICIQLSFLCIFGKIFSFTNPFSGNKNYAREAELIAVRGRYYCRVSSCSALLVVQKGVHCISALWQPYCGTEVVELFSGFPDEVKLQGKKTDFCDCE
jgi:hypothetical protein